MRHLLPALLIVATASAMAAPPKVLFSTLATSPTSDLPGYPGVKFVTTLSRIYASPNGRFFSMTGIQPSSGRSLTIGEIGVPGTYTTIAKTGEPWFFGSGLTISDIRSISGINDNGNVGFNANSTEATSGNEYMLKRVGGVITVVAKEGDTAPQNGLPFVSGFASTQILADNTAIWCTGINSTSLAGCIFNETAVLAARGITVPTGQGGTPAPIMRFDTDKLRVGQVDNSFIYQAVVGEGSVTANGSSVVAVDNQVVAQTGFSIAGSPVTTLVGSFGAVANGGASISASNRHFAFSGRFNDGQDFAYIGRVGGSPRFVFEGEPVASGSTETWSATGTVFSGTAINSYGEYVICGLTSNPDTTKNFVVVFNNGFFSQVIFRRDDAIDLDGNGVGDDNLQFQAIASDNLMFCDNNRLFLGATLRSGGGTTAGLAQIWMDLPITGDVDGSQEVDAADIDNVIAQFGSTTPGIPEDVDGSGEVDAADIDIVIANFGRTR